MENTLFALAVCLLVLLAGAGPAAGAGNAGTPDPGAVTIVSHNGPDYRSGDNITFFGTNTASGTTYLFITGPNLPENGSQIDNRDPRHRPVTEGNASTFRAAPAGSDGRWSWTWDTRDAALAPGIYILYAVSRPHDRAHLELTPYGTIAVIITDKDLPSAGRDQDALPAGVAVSEISVDPAGDPDEGTPVTVSAAVDLPATGTETFPSSADLLLQTGLDKSRWNVTLFLDGVANPLPESGGKAMPLTGWLLSYPPSVRESLGITLQGTVPPGQPGTDLTLLRITVISGQGNPSDLYIRTVKIRPKATVTVPEHELFGSSGVGGSSLADVSSRVASRFGPAP